MWQGVSGGSKELNRRQQYVYWRHQGIGSTILGSKQQGPVTARRRPACFAPGS